MAKVIIWNSPIKGIVVRLPAYNDMRPGETEDEFLTRAWESHIPEGGVLIGIMDAAAVPTDRTFRNAWKGDLSVDMPGAREIWRKKMREVRAPLFKVLDEKMSRAYKDPVLQDQIEVERQRLRDVTIEPGIDQANTPDDLKTVWPAILDGPPVLPEPVNNQPTKIAALIADAAANATTTGVKVPGLDQALSSGIYTFQYVIRYRAAVATTGVKFGINYTGATSSIVANLRYQENTTAASTGAASQAQAAAGRLVAGASCRSLSTTAPNLGPTVSVDIANQDMLAVIEGMFMATGAGALELWHGSEVAASSQVMAGSSVVITKVG